MAKTCFLPLALAVALALALSIAPLVAAQQIDLSQAVVLRGYTVDATTGAKTLASTVNASMSFPAPLTVRVDDSANAADGVIAIVDLSLVTDLYGAFIARAIDVNNAGLSFAFGDLQNQLSSDYAIIWKDPSQGYRVWVPGNDYLSVSAIYVDPGADGAVYEVHLTPYEPSTTTLSGTPSKTFQGQTPPEFKTKITLAKGDKVTIVLEQASGDNDVYVFKPSNANYSTVEQATNQQWFYYSPKSDFKIWWPSKQVSFVAPESGDYLLVVVPFKQGGSFTLKIYIEKPVKPEPQPNPGNIQPAPVEKSESNTQWMAIAIGAGIIALAIAAVWVVSRLS